MPQCQDFKYNAGLAENICKSITILNHDNYISIRDGSGWLRTKRAMVARLRDNASSVAVPKQILIEGGIGQGTIGRTFEFFGIWRPHCHDLFCRAS